ncbi:MAG: translation elongation factor Ts [Anaerolineae bacterium]
MQITAQMIKELREATGAGPLDCKKALEGNDGDMQKALDYLREKGLARAVKKLGATERATNEGIVEFYQHHDKRVGVMVEVNCETDFVANTDNFRRFAKDVALHIANMNPEYLRIEDVPAAVIQAEKEVQLRRVLEEGKPQNVAEKIVEGRMKKFYEDLCLMEQPFVKDDAKTISQLLQETVAAVGERVEVRRFARFAIEKETNVSG